MGPAPELHLSDLPSLRRNVINWNQLDSILRIGKGVPPLEANKLFPEYKNNMGQINHSCRHTALCQPGLLNPRLEFTWEGKTGWDPLVQFPSESYTLFATPLHRYPPICIDSRESTGNMKHTLYLLLPLEYPLHRKEDHCHLSEIWITFCEPASTLTDVIPPFLTSLTRNHPQRTTIGATWLLPSLHHSIWL